MSNPVLIGIIKDTTVHEKVTKSTGKVRYYQSIMIEMDDERKKIDIQLDSPADVRPLGTYEVDLLSLIMVEEKFGQRVLGIRPFTSPELKPVSGSVQSPILTDVSEHSDIKTEVKESSVKSPLFGNKAVNQ